MNEWLEESTRKTETDLGNVKSVGIRVRVGWAWEKLELACTSIIRHRSQCGDSYEITNLTSAPLSNCKHNKLSHIFPYLRESGKFVLWHVWETFLVSCRLDKLELWMRGDYAFVFHRQTSEDEVSRFFFISKTQSVSSSLLSEIKFSFDVHEKLHQYLYVVQIWLSEQKVSAVAQTANFPLSSI